MDNATDAAPARISIARVHLEEADLEFDYAIPDELKSRVRVGARVHVPLQNQRVVGVVLQLIDDSPFRKQLRAIHDTISSRPVFTENLVKLAHWIADYYVCAVRQVLRAMLPEAVRSKPASFLSDSEISLLRHPTEQEWTQLRKVAPIRARVLDLVIAQGGKATLSTLRKEYPRATQTIPALVSAGFVARAEIRVERDPFGEEEFLPSVPHELTEEQQKALAAIALAQANAAQSRPILLHGITGSGKTEIYLQSIAKVLEAGQTALVLVPEISLTPQTIERFKSRFNDRKHRIAVLHSHLSDGERHDEWYKIHESRADIVIGARSAIFAPLENLGIIIVDEEHEPSYKQEETPRYHARDIAVLRAKLEGCVCLLGSATPSLESFENAQRGKYELVRMINRTDGKSLPLVRLVDLRLEKRKTKEGFSILSERLRLAIQNRLDKGEQTILFLNRRGFNTNITCLDCGAVCQCPECAVSLTFHKMENQLVCHICGQRQLPPKKCRACGQPSVLYAGFGTERAEATLRHTFPKARIARVDTDTMQKKNALRDTLKAFRAQKIDLLIGTQMIAKGLDFPNVTLVGVLNADLALNLPDFRAAERTFQLLTQVSGRAGRGEVKGEVFIQTYTPHSPAIQFSRHGDFEGFAQQELEQRDQFRYPPYTHLVVIGCRSKQESLAEFTLQSIAHKLRQGGPADAIIGIPAPSPLAKSHGQFRFQLLLRATRAKALMAHVQKCLTSQKFPDEVTITADVDAIQLL